MTGLDLPNKVNLYKNHGMAFLALFLKEILEPAGAFLQLLFMNRK